VFLLVSSSFASLTFIPQVQAVKPIDEWTQINGGPSMTRFAAGTAPNTPNILWKANISGIQPYLTAFNGKIYVCSTTTAYALNQEGEIVWQTDFPEPTHWPVAYKIDDTHMVI